MTNPPQGSDEPGRDHRPGAEDPIPIGASGMDPDRFATQPTPTVQQSPPASQYGQNPSYGQAPPYGQAPQYGQAAQYGQPQPPPYGQAAPPPSFGPPAQPGYGHPGYGQPHQQYGAPQYGPAQYGAPGQQYGGPGGTPAEKSKVGLIALVTGVLLVVIAGVVALVMSLQSTVLDPDAVERDVAAQFQEREGVAIELDCAGDMEVDEGATYECRGTTADGESVTLQIAITDAETAAYTWTEP